jgi:hypothetical protein
VRRITLCQHARENDKRKGGIQNVFLLLLMPGGRAARVGVTVVPCAREGKMDRERKKRTNHFCVYASRAQGTLATLRNFLVPPHLSDRPRDCRADTRAPRGFFLGPLLEEPMDLRVDDPLRRVTKPLAFNPVDPTEGVELLE